MWAENHKTKTLAYMDVYPAGFIFEINPTEETYNYVTDITKMGYNFSYNDLVDFGLPLNILDRNTLLAGDFRSKDDIIQQIENSKNKTVEIVLEKMRDLKIEKEQYEKIIDYYLNNKIDSNFFSKKIEEIINNKVLRNLDKS